ncbi:MAG: hypothetical protein QXE81_02290 [Desulfurococcaceae archaeon]
MTSIDLCLSEIAPSTIQLNEEIRVESTIRVTQSRRTHYIKESMYIFLV